MTTALPNKLCSGNHEATQEDSDQRNTWRRDLESEMGAAGFKCSYKKMKAEARDRTGWRKVVCGLCSTWSNKS